MPTFFMRDRRFYLVFFSMTATIALQNAIVFAVNLADAIMLSRYSETALSGVALLNQVQFLLQMLVFGVAEGALIFSSRSWGEGKIEPIREVTNIALRFGVGLALLLSLLVLFLPGTILGLLTSDRAIIAVENPAVLFKVIQAQFLVGPVSSGFLQTPLQQRPVGQKELQPAGGRVAEQSRDQFPGLLKEFRGLSGIGNRRTGAV